MEFRMFIFYWLCMVTDFIGVFATLAAAFYNPYSEGGTSLTIFGEMWIYKVLFSTFLMVVCGGLLMFCGFTCYVYL